MQGSIQGKVNKSEHKPILIVDDTDDITALLKGICDQMHLDTVIAHNGQEALDLLEKESFSIYLVDLMMPVMDGREFIMELKRRVPDALILVQTGLDDPKVIIEIMKLKVCDYIIKPFDKNLIISALEKSLEVKRLQDIEKEMKETVQIKLQAQLDWYSYKTSKADLEKIYMEKNAVYNIQTSLSQGSGFGTMTSLIELMKMTSKETDEFFQVDKDILRLIYENNETNKVMLDGLAKVVACTSKNLEFESLSIQSIFLDLQKVSEKFTSVLKEKRLNLQFGQVKMFHDLNIARAEMISVLEELLINSIKYAKEDSNIDVISYKSGNYIGISIKNSVNEKNVIPKESEKMVLEPFFRINPLLETGVGSLGKFAFGLGLAVVDNIVRKHSGIFYIHTVNDHSSKRIDKAVLAEIFLPIFKTEELLLNN